MKKHIHHFLNHSIVGGILLTALILISVFAFFLETEYENSAVLQQLGFGIAAIFGIEYVLRIWTADLAFPGKGARKYISSFGGIIDLLAFLPVLLFPAASGSIVIRLIRILRLVQIFKIRPITRGIQRTLIALRASWNELLASLMISVILIVFGAVLMYMAEGHVQPEAFGSVPRALWWSVATLTTVGYGDVYPITAAGRIIAAVVAIFGILSVAVPAGIFAAAFQSVGIKD